jgi:hypothetical protein
VPGALDHVRVCLPRMRWIAVRSQLGLSVLLIALTLAVYARALRFGFVVFDDPRYVTDNFHVLSGLSLRGIRWAFSTFHDCNWIPLTWLLLMLDATLYGCWAGGFHATNILLHIANVLLVFFCFQRATGQTGRSAFVAALFAVHPLHVESVAWITERKDVLSMFCGLVSLWAYIRYAQGRHYAWLALSLGSFTCSLASKQTFVTLPFVFLLCDFWPLGRFPGAPGSVREDATLRERLDIAPLLVEKIPLFVVSAAFCAMALWAQSAGHSTRSLADMPLSIRALNAVSAYGPYLEKGLLPCGLAIFYPHPGLRIEWAAVALSVTVLTAITVFAITTVRRWPFVLMGWLWFLGTLVPMIGLVQVGLQQRADRYVYLPNLGLYIAIAWLVPAIVTAPIARRRVLPAVAGAVVAVYATIAFAQVGQWRDGIVLMRHALAVKRSKQPRDLWRGVARPKTFRGGCGRISSGPGNRRSLRRRSHRPGSGPLGAASIRRGPRRVSSIAGNRSQQRWGLFGPGHFVSDSRRDRTIDRIRRASARTRGHAALLPTADGHQALRPGTSR